jgi:hypothetical protein
MVYPRTLSTHRTHLIDLILFNFVVAAKYAYVGGEEVGRGKKGLGRK